jgi:alkylation response protein AidB-like acyl-CoA dehydrogenase
MVMELLAQADSAAMNMYGLTEGAAEIINRFASEELKQRFLPKLCSGEWTGAMAMTEPQAGSDLGRITCKACHKDGKWFLKGTKSFITMGCGDVLLILARSDPNSVDMSGLSLFVCPKSDQVEIVSLEDKLGVKASPTSEIYFDDAESFLLGEEGNGFKLMLTLMNYARVAVGAQSNGIARAAFNEALTYAQEREQFEGPIILQPPVKELLENMKITLEAMRCLTYKCAEEVDLEIGYSRKLRTMATDDPERADVEKKMKKHRDTARVLTPLSKYWCSEKCIEITSNALQILGGSGYMKDYPLERLFRDARVTSIYEGTSQIQALMAMKDILGQKFASTLDDISRFVEGSSELQEEDDPSETPEKEEVAATDYGYDDFFGRDQEGVPAQGAGSLSADCESSIVKLRKAKELFYDASLYLLQDIGERNSDQYAKLCAEKLAKIAAMTYVGYQFHLHAEKSDRKRLVARKWMFRVLPEIEALHEYITSGDQSTIDDFDRIVMEME